MEVSGHPRKTTGHPCTLWDQEDIAQLKDRLKTNKALQEKLAEMAAEADKSISKPANLPLSSPPTNEIWSIHKDNSKTISNLGILYALTGETKYGERCKSMLLAYAKAYPEMPRPKEWTEKKYRSAQDWRLSPQFLADGLWLAKTAFGADLIYNLPSWTPEERKLLRENLFEAIASNFYHPVITAVKEPIEQQDYTRAAHNRAAICSSAILMAGYASDSQSLINIGLYGVGGTPEKPLGGAFGTYFTEKCMLADGLWNEGAPAYQVGIASCAMINFAEILWHHGIDLYRHKNGALKRLIDSTLALADPNPEQSIATLRDAQPFALLDQREWFTAESTLSYQYGYRRYQNPAYIPIIRNGASTRQLSQSSHAGPPSLFQEFPPDLPIPAPDMDHANFFATGFGILRLKATGGYHQLIMESGKCTEGAKSHAHPSKLAIDMFALGDRQLPFPGVIFPYGDPLNPKWFWTTLSNCTLTIDRQSQIYSKTLYKYKDRNNEPEAPQIVFAPASTIGLQRAWSDNLYPFKMIQDRSLFFTGRYLADLFLASGDEPHQFDLAWHFRGSLDSSTLKFSPHQFPAPVPDGYNSISDLHRAICSSTPWTANLKTANSKPIAFFSAGVTETEVFHGKGHLVGREEGMKRENPVTVIQSCEKQPEALFGSVIDLSGADKGIVKKVTQDGSLKLGYGLLLVETTEGTDLCFTSFRAGTYKASGLETDALQAFVGRNGNNIHTLYLAGGKSLAIDKHSLQRNTPGLAYLEPAPGGGFYIGNPSPSEATISVVHPALYPMEAVQLDPSGAPAGAAIVERDTITHRIVLQMKSGSRVLLQPKKSD